MRSRTAHTLAVVFGLLTWCHAQSEGPYKSLGDLFDGELANITRQLPGNPALGGQDFGRCCDLAVNESLEIVNGHVQYKPGQTVIQDPISIFLSHQYPCTAWYNGSDEGGPQVLITYSWCRDNCNGWAKTETSIQSDWLEPFVGFILPTVVFCFAIPRRKAFVTPSAIFPGAGLLAFPQNLTLLYKLPLAALVIIFDTVQWVVVCIVMAGPMLLAGVFEAVIDARIMGYLRSHGHRLNPQRRAHLLLVVLIGNLDVDPAWKHSTELLDVLADSHAATGADEQGHRAASPLEKAELKVSSTENGHGDLGNKAEIAHKTPTIPSTSSSSVAAQTVKRRLVSLLESPTPFGTAVGIGVLFFSTSFFYSINQIQDSYGDP